MRSLTQVWLFFLILTFLFLLLGFQLAGRLGLLGAFLLSILIVYATLQRGLNLFKKKLNAQEFTGNDPSGFLTEVQKNKSRFGFKKVFVYRTAHNTPPLIWRSNSKEGHLLLNEHLLNNLNPEEIKLLSLFLLAHLENRSFLVTPILSVINQSLLNIKLISSGISAVFASLFRISKDVLKSDKKFKLMSDASNFEIGYFMNKLHNLAFNQNKKSLGTEYFSVLSPAGGWFNQYGMPDLDFRLKAIMGFSLSR